MQNLLEREFSSADALMLEVYSNGAQIADEIRICVDPLRQERNKAILSVGTLAFPRVKIRGETIAREVRIDVFYRSGWGFMYRHCGSEGYLNPCNNGTLDDLLRNSKPHGLPVQGTLWTPLAEPALWSAQKA